MIASHKTHIQHQHAFALRVCCITFLNDLSVAKSLKSFFSFFPDSYLQDVQEEDEEPARGSGIAKMLELSGVSQGDSSNGDGEETEISRLRMALDDLQAKNTMLQDELTMLSNVKTEMEAELDRAKEEFQMEKEELEFKINELQLTRENAPNDPEQQDAHGESNESTVGPEEKERLAQELRVQCETLTRDRDSALAECQHMREILEGVETELGEKTKDFVLQYKAMKEQAANTVEELQDKLTQLTQERDGLMMRIKEVTEEKNTLRENMVDQKLEPEGSSGDDEKLKASVEEQTTVIGELKQSVEDLTKRNEEILSQMHMKENLTQDLKEMVSTLTEERDKVQSLVQMQEEEMQKLADEKAQEFERLLEEKEKDTLLLREEKEKLIGLKNEKEAELQHLKEEMHKVEECLKEEVDKKQEAVSALELTIKELSAEKEDLHQKLEEASSGLIKTQEARELLGSNLAALEAQLEQETSEKHCLETKLNSVAEEAEQARASIRALEENQNEALKNSTDEIEELRVRVDELEKERDLLRSRLDEAQGERGIEDVQKELQAQIKDLEEERNMLRSNLEEVVKDSEGLQKDLLDMKAVSEKISEENQKLQAQLSLMTEEKEEKEKGEMDSLEKERKEYREQLVEKDSVISQLRSEMVALQVSVILMTNSKQQK